METLNTLKQLMEVQRGLLTDSFWLDLCESQLWTSSPLGEVLSDIEYHEGGDATKSKWGGFVVGGDNGYKEHEWQEVLEF